MCNDAKRIIIHSYILSSLLIIHCCIPSYSFIYYMWDHANCSRFWVIVCIIDKAHVCLIAEVACCKASIFRHAWFFFFFFPGILWSACSINYLLVILLHAWATVLTPSSLKDCTTKYIIHFFFIVMCMNLYFVAFLSYIFHLVGSASLSTPTLIELYVVFEVMLLFQFFYALLFVNFPWVLV